MRPGVASLTATMEGAAACRGGARLEATKVDAEAHWGGQTGGDHGGWGGGPGWGWARPAIIAGDLRDSCRGGGAHGREADTVKAEGAARTGGPHVG
jgi:hypothetical protein